MELKLWLIKRDPNEVEYDENEGFVIASETEDGARAIASEAAGDEGGAMWLSGFSSWVTYLGQADTAISEGIVLRDFNAG